MKQFSSANFFPRFALFTLSVLCFNSSTVAHPGPTDINGGHYMGSSYHCHDPFCEMPDTFRTGRDSLLSDPRDREKFFNEVDWEYEMDFDGDCQSTRQEMLILTSRAEIKYTN